MSDIPERYQLPIEQRRRRIGFRRVITYPSALAVSRLEREAKKRGTTVDLLLARLLEVLGNEDMYAAVLDDGK